MCITTSNSHTWASRFPNRPLSTRSSARSSALYLVTRSARTIRARHAHVARRRQGAPAVRRARRRRTTRPSSASKRPTTPRSTSCRPHSSSRRRTGRGQRGGVRSSPCRAARVDHGTLGCARRDRDRTRRRRSTVRVAVGAGGLPHRRCRVRSRRVRHHGLRRVSPLRRRRCSGCNQSDWLEMDLGGGHRARGPLLPLQRTAPHAGPGARHRSSCLRRSTTSCSRRTTATTSAPPSTGLGRQACRSRTVSAGTTTTACSASTSPARPASRSRSATAPDGHRRLGRQPPLRPDQRVGSPTAAPSMTGHLSTDDSRSSAYGPVGSVLADPARAAGPHGNGARTVAGAVPAAACRALRPRGRPHPAGLRDRRRARAPITEPAEVYEWRNAAGTTLLRFGRIGMGRRGWPQSSMFNQPELEALLEARAGDCRRSTCAAGSRSTGDRAGRRRRDGRRWRSTGRRSTCAPLCRRLRRGEQHGARPARHRPRPTSASSTTG